MLRMALIGCGNMGGAHKRAIEQLSGRVRIVAAVDPDEARVAATAPQGSALRPTYFPITASLTAAPRTICDTESKEKISNNCLTPSIQANQNIMLAMITQLEYDVETTIRSMRFRTDRGVNHAVFEVGKLTKCIRN